MKKLVIILIIFFVISIPVKIEAQTFTFVTEWGSYGTGDGNFDTPVGIGIDSDNNVYVADTNNHRIQKFNSSGTFVTKWGGVYGSGDGEFKQPIDIAIDSDDNVYVTDYGNHRVQKFTSSGTFLTKWGTEGAGDGQFSYPRGIDIDSDGNIYVVDASNHRVQKFNSAATFVTKWGSFGSGDGAFDTPRGVNIDSGNNIYVTDYGNNRVQKFTSAGTFVTKWGSYGTGDGEFDGSSDVVVDSDDNIYVTDYGNDRVERFTSAGTFVTEWGSYGTGDGEFNTPIGIAIDSAGDIYVVDAFNHRVQKFTIPQSPIYTYLTGPGTTYPQGINTNGLVGYWKLGTNYKTDGTILGNYGSDPPNLTKSGTTIVDDPKYGPVRYFDGTDDYLTQEIFDTQQGALSYIGNDTTTAEFRDAGQNFSDWVSSDSASYMLVVTNDDASVSWGYCGASDQATDIDIYTDIGLTSRGWKGVAPVAGSKTPSTYEVRRTDFQITDGELTLGIWIKTGVAVQGHLMTKRNDSEVHWQIFCYANGTLEVDYGGISTSLVGTTDIHDGAWHMITVVFSGGNGYVYIDTILDVSGSTTSSGIDAWSSLYIGARGDGSGTVLYLDCIIADAFIYNRVLSLTEIKRIYDHPPRIVTRIQ